MSFTRPLSVPPLSPWQADGALIAQLRGDVIDRDSQIDALKSAMRELQSSIETIGVNRVGGKRLYIYWFDKPEHARLTLDGIRCMLDVLAGENPGCAFRLVPRYEGSLLVGMDLLMTAGIAPLSVA